MGHKLKFHMLFFWSRLLFISVDMQLTYTTIHHFKFCEILMGKDYKIIPLATVSASLLSDTLSFPSLSSTFIEHQFEDRSHQQLTLIMLLALSGYVLATVAMVLA